MLTLKAYRRCKALEIPAILERYLINDNIGAKGNVAKVEGISKAHPSTFSTKDAVTLKKLQR